MLVLIFLMPLKYSLINGSYGLIRNFFIHTFSFKVIYASKGGYNKCILILMIFSKWNYCFVVKLMLIVRLPCYPHHRFGIIFQGGSRKLTQVFILQKHFTKEIMF